MGGAVRGMCGGAVSLSPSLTLPLSLSLCHSHATATQRFCATGMFTDHNNQHEHLVCGFPVYLKEKSQTTHALLMFVSDLPITQQHVGAQFPTMAKKLPADLRIVQVCGQ